MTEEKKYCPDHIAHSNEIVVLREQVSDLKEVKKALFEKTDNLARIAERNETNISSIRVTLENGFTDQLEKKIDRLCKGFDDHRKELQSMLWGERGIDDRLKKLEGSNWVTKIVEAGFKKVILAALVAALVFGGVQGVINSGIWGMAKAIIFKETPGLMKSKIGGKVSGQD